MRHGFDPLGDHIALEGRGQTDDALDDCHIVCIVEHVPHKALVDLQQAGRQASQVGQRGIPGTEVVQRKPDAHRKAGVHQLADLLHVFERIGLHDLELEQLRIHPRVGCKQRSKTHDEIALLQLACADVHADRQVQSGGTPCIQLAEHRIDHPLTNLDADDMILDLGQKTVRHQQAANRMLPPDQRLQADHHPGLQVDLGLVVKQKLSPLEALADGLAAGVQGFEFSVVADVEKVAAILAGLLGQIHGLVGMAHQHFGLCGILRHPADTA